MAEMHSALNVFTPTKPAEITFVERDTLNNQLVDAIRTPGKQIVVYGHSGSGKTTLLRHKLRQTVEEEEIVSRCVVGTTFEELLRDAFDRLGSFYEKARVSKKADDTTKGFSANYLNIKAEISKKNIQSNQIESERLISIQLSPQRLVDFLGAAKKIWVIEDFHKLDPREKSKFSQCMKIFMDSAGSYPQTKIIAIGAAGTAREVIQYDSEMRNRVSEVYVPLMSDKELELIINMGEKALNIEFDNIVKGQIVRFSSGLAAVCHQLCLNVCFSADVIETQRSTYAIGCLEVKKAIRRYVDDSSDTLKRGFDLATRQSRKGKYNNGFLIVRALAQLGADGVSHNDLLTKIRMKYPKYPSGNLATYLAQMQTPERGELVRFDAAANKYTFSNPIYQAYALAVLRKREDEKSENSLGDSGGFDEGEKMRIYAKTFAPPDIHANDLMFQYLLETLQSVESKIKKSLSEK